MHKFTKYKFLLLLLAQLCCGALLRAADYPLIDSLPAKLAAAKIEGHKGWDNGNSGEMKSATYKYNDALAGFIKSLAAAYHTEDPAADKVDDYVKSLYTLHRAKQEKADPDGDFHGSMSELDILSDVSDDLEKKVISLVQKITAHDSKFDYPAWKKKWDAAWKTGD